jgi:hypothetical protein
MLFPNDTIKPAILVKVFSVIERIENSKLIIWWKACLNSSLSLLHVKRRMGKRFPEVLI